MHMMRFCKVLDQFFEIDTKLIKNLQMLSRFMAIKIVRNILNDFNFSKIQ